MSKVNAINIIPLSPMKGSKMILEELSQEEEVTLTHGNETSKLKQLSSKKHYK